MTTLRTFCVPSLSPTHPQASAWLSDPEVMRFIPGGADKDMTAVESRLARYISHQQLHGFSKWLVIDRATQEGLGDAGLSCSRMGAHRARLSFAAGTLGPGYAQEVGRAWIAHFQQRRRRPSSGQKTLMDVVKALPAKWG